MKKSYFILPFLMASLLLFGNALLFAKEKGDAGTTVLDAVVSQNTANRTLVNVGQVAMWIYASGQSSITPQGGAGLFYPRASNPVTSAIFQDGLVWGGKVNDGQEPSVRVGGAQYNVGHVPGKILSRGVAEDRTSPSVNRIWRIRRDYATADLTLDASEINNINVSQVSPAQVDAVRATYKQDWIDWPASKGAPFYDADGDGVYTPGFRTNTQGVEVPKLAPAADVTFDPALHADEPGVANADQVVWLVSNDLDRATLSNFSGSIPIGVEQQVTLWAYARADELGQIIFKQFRLIYKGDTNTPVTARVDSMYFCQWSDPDVGSSGDDLAGCDTLLSLGYAYNSNAADAVYSAAGFPPPASGYDFFAGPLVDDPNGTAIFGLKLRPGMRNLPMTGFTSFAPGSPASDPGPLGTYNVTLQWFNLLRGFLPRPESPATPFIDPVTGQSTKFTLYGNPRTGEGWVDNGSGDRRIVLSSGPFTMALGDTQETVVATMAAIGSDRISSVEVLKFVDRFAQEAFDNLFELPTPPAAPNVRVAELDGAILLNWAFDATRVATTEGLDNKGHVFEGYNVYQLPSAGATRSQGVRLATFDAINDFTTISQESFDIPSGLVLNLPVQFGSNSGIQRTVEITNDAIRNLNLVNGQTYYFGVSAYSINPDPDATVKSLESAMTIVTVVPQTPKPGVRLQAASGDTISGVEHANTAGGALSSGDVTPIVVDPTAITGDDYVVSFRKAPVVDLSDPEHPETTLVDVWDLTNTSTGEVLLAAQTNQSGDDNYLVADGLLIKVLGAPLDFAPGDGSGAGIIEITYAGNDACAPGSASTGGCATLGGNTVWHSANSTGHYYVTAGGGAGDLSRVTRYIGNAVPYDYEMRFTDAGGLGIWAFTDDMIGTTPFEIWNIGIGTPDDPSDDTRMIPFLLENVATAPAWGWATGADPAFGFPMSDWVYWMEAEDRSPGSASYDNMAAAATAAGGPGATYPFATDGSRDGYFADFQGGFVYPIGRLTLADLGGVGSPPPSGTTIRLLTTKPNSVNDEFTFSTSAYSSTVSTANAKEDVLDLVNVFPNPYYGVNRFEENRFNRFITFSHLPQKATIRIFNLAGVLVRTIEKDDPSQFTNWDMLNEHQLPVASGLYIANVEMPDLDATKNLKIAIVQEQQFLRRF